LLLRGDNVADFDDLVSGVIRRRLNPNDFDLVFFGDLVLLENWTVLLLRGETVVVNPFGCTSGKIASSVAIIILLCSFLLLQ